MVIGVELSLVSERGLWLAPIEIHSFILAG